MAEARTWAAEMEKAKELGNVKHSKVRTVEQLINDYLPLAKNTNSGKWNELRLLKLCNDPLAKVALHQIAPHEINEWSGHRLQEIKPAPVNRELNLIRGMFTHGVKVRKWLNENPCKDALKLPAGERRNRPLLTLAEIEAIAIATGYRDHPKLLTRTARVGACFLLAMETAMLRSGEILRLRLKDYDRNVRVVYVHALKKGGRKGSKSARVAASRWIPLTNRAVELLDQLLETMPEDQEALPDFSMPPYIAGLTDKQRDALWRCQCRSGNAVICR